MLRAPKDERGFILIGAIWLLMLCASIAAILMLRGLNEGKAAKTQATSMATRFALESAVETAAADILFNGQRSHWALLPAESAVPISDRTIQVRVSNEVGRLDLNDANPEEVASALQGFGFAAAERQPLLDELEQRHIANHRLQTWAEVPMILAKLPADRLRSTCLVRELTLYSGLAAPRPNQVSPELGHALGLATSAEPALPDPGSALRFEAFSQDGARLLEVLRITGTIGRPITILRREFNPPCGSRA